MRKEESSMSKEDMIRAIGECAYEAGIRLAETGSVCPYDEETPVGIQLKETGKCARCFAPQCPINS